MKKWDVRLRPSAWLPVLALAAVPGCGSNDLDSPTANRLRGLARVYLDYAVPRNGKGPDSEQAFKKHVRALPDFVLRTNGVDPADIEAVFASERDREPFVVRYGITIGSISGTSAAALAHEKTGRNGKRLIVFANAKVELADDARLRELFAAQP
jgi:hypothetical protein